MDIKIVKEKEQLDTELAHFWYDIEQKLPRSRALSEIGEDRIFSAIKEAYINIRPFIVAAGRKAERCDMRNTIIPKYNAEILNQFQQQGTPTMPLIAYDERVCLIPAMDKAILFLDDLINARNEKENKDN